MRSACPTIRRMRSGSSPARSSSSRSRSARAADAPRPGFLPKSPGKTAYARPRRYHLSPDAPRVPRQAPDFARCASADLYRPRTKGDLHAQQFDDQAFVGDPGDDMLQQFVFYRAFAAIPGQQIFDEAELDGLRFFLPPSVSMPVAPWARSLLVVCCGRAAAVLTFSSAKILLPESAPSPPDTWLTGIAGEK